jgi:mono/diheme cytochrome c family protein
MTMRARISLIAALLGAAACASQAPPPTVSAPQVQLVSAGEPVRGRAYAQDACASCHGIGPGEETSPIPDAPSFYELANTPGMTSIAIRAWLNSPHENMPQLIIGPEQSDDLSAYILSLKRRSE